MENPATRSRVASFQGFLSRRKGVENLLPAAGANHPEKSSADPAS